MNNMNKKEIYAVLKGEKFVIGYADKDNNLTLKKDLDISKISKKKYGKN